jgi:hypothetical protein
MMQGTGTAREREANAQQPIAGRSTMIGTSLICFCILANLGYSVGHDWRAAEAVKATEARQAQIYLDNQRRIQTKEAWKRALKYLDIGFKQWIERGYKSGEYASIDYAWVKTFAMSDVEWIDSTHAKVGSVFGAVPAGSRTGPNLYSWSRKVKIVGDGVDTWWEVEPPQFQYIAAKPGEFKDVKIVTIYDHADGDRPNELAR